jgi:hypothetical protein
MLLAMIAVAAMIATPALAQEPQLLFHADFEGDLTAEVAAGEAEAALLRRAEDEDEAIEQIERTDGVVGQAVVTEEEYVRYPAGANLNAEAGTVEVWVKPIDWTGDDELFHVFFKTNNRNPGWLILYKYQKTEDDRGISRSLTFYVGGDPGEERVRRLMVPKTRVDWQPGTWHHVAGTWQNGRARLYIDGAMVREDTGGAVPDGPFSQLNFGQPWGGPGPRTTAIDEARIYDAPLSADAIRASFAAGLARLAERSPEEMPRASAVVKTLGFPTQRRLVAYVSAAGAPADAGDLTGQLSLVPLGGEEPAVVQDLPAFDPSRECFAWIDTSEVEPGEYEVRASIGGPGLQPLAAGTEHEIPERPEWWQNDLGVTDEVLPPYTPIETDGLVVSPWGRDYVFSDALILRGLVAHPDPNAQISELADRFHTTTDLLAGPIAVAGIIDGEPVRIESGQPNVVDSADDAVRIASRASEAGVRFSTAVLLEYDGIAQVRLTIEPDDPVEMRQMRVEIPLPNDLVTLMNFNSVDGFKLNCFAGAAPAGEGVVWEESWLPLIWLGDEYRGLCWFNDRWDGWSGDVMRKGRVQLVREGGAATLRLNFAPELNAQADPITLNFCLVGTPTRTMPEGWRGLVRDGAVTRPEPRDPIDGPLDRPVDFRVWWSHGPGMTDHHAYPVPLHSEETMREVWNYEDGGPSDIQHHYPNNVTGDRPISATWYGDWANVSTADLLDKLTLEAPGGGRVDWNTNVRDWWLWEINAMMEPGLDGMYFDDPYIYPSYNDRTGGAVREEDGTVRPSYGMLGLREYFRRTRALAFERSDRPWIDIHMSAQLMLPFYVFCDSFLNGEHLNMKLSKDDPDYFDVLPVAELKAQYMGYQWGLAPFLLPELPEGFRRSEPKTREILAYFLPHDVYFWRAWSDPATLNAALKPLQTEFGIGDADNRFLPYWEAAGTIGGQTETLVCSAHIKPGRAMLVIGNWAEEPAELDLALDLEALGLADVADLTATDPVDGAEMVLDGGRLTGSLGARDYRLVLLSGEQGAVGR